MSSSLKKRIVLAVIYGIIVFVIISIIYKFKMAYENWLLYSLCWAIPFVIGLLTPKTLGEKGESMLVIR